MFLSVVYLRLIISCFLIGVRISSNFVVASQDQTSSRANTLLDDADDIQRQLDNEARDRIKYGRPKTIWVFHLPSQYPDFSAIENVTRQLRHVTPSWNRDKRRKDRRKLFTKVKMEASPDWNYKEQSEWPKLFPACGGRSQSPVDLPYRGLVAAQGGRRLAFTNYDVKPEALALDNDGKRVILRGKWPKGKQPYIFGGPAQSRRYLFHSMTFHWPSEHSVGRFYLPLESQALHISAEYRTMERALEATASDPLAFLAVSTMYKFSNHTHQGLADLIKVAVANKGFVTAAVDPMPLKHFSPAMAEYACYQGSLSWPPCNEAVLWLIRGKTLPVTRNFMESVNGLTSEPIRRSVQPLNDRKAYYFRN